MNLFPPLEPKTRRILDRVPALVDRVFPLPGRFRASLPRDVAELSRLLTSGRGERKASYLGKPEQLSAYMRFFFPWNLFRLSRLLPSLPLDLGPLPVVTDLGAGPLTFAAALWISRPDLRELPLEFRCIDRIPAALKAGERFFDALTEKEPCPWKIKTIHGNMDIPVYGQKAGLVSAVNVFNEVYQDLPHTVPLSGMAGQAVRLLSSLTGDGGSMLVVEPGIPRSGEFIASLRAGLLAVDRGPLSPCSHGESCPVPGRGGGKKKQKWCHFAFDTEDAPPALHRLSAAASLPKERAALSFLLAGPLQKKAAAPAPKETSGGIEVRIISDAFPLEGGAQGRYGCSQKGLVLVSGGREIEKLFSGSLVWCVSAEKERDRKSGALVCRPKDAGRG